MLETIASCVERGLDESAEAGDLALPRHGPGLPGEKGAEPQLSGAETDAAAKQLDLERDNVRAALEWADGRDAGLVLPIAAPLERYW